MMEEKCYTLLNKAFELMIGNKLRVDMDDTLLEKLLCLIRDESEVQSLEKLDFLDNLMQKTNALHLAEKAMISLTETDTLSTSVSVFAVRLMGLIFKHEIMFASPKCSQLLVKLSIALNQIPTKHAPSIQDALLNCLLPIAQHPKGTLWIIQQNLLNFVFTSFSCTSYYVRKTVVRFFNDVLPSWTSKYSSFSPEEQPILKEAIENILSRIIKGVQLSGTILNPSVNDCCICVLKELLKVDDLKEVIVHSQHFKNILDQFNHFVDDDARSSNISSLLLSLFAGNDKFEAVVKDGIQQFVKNAQFLPALNLASSFLLTADKYKPFSRDHLYFILTPLYVLSGETEMQEKTFLGTSEIYPTLLKEIEVKSNCVKLISTSLCLLSKMTSFMNPEALEAVVDKIHIVVNGPTSDTHHHMAYVCLQNRSIILALLELFKSLLSEASVSDLTSLNPAANIVLYKLSIFEYLLCFLERPSLDCNILSEVLKLLKEVMVMNVKFSIEVPGDMKEKFVQLLSRKILDNKEPVVDDSLLIAGHILSGKGNEVWQEMVFKHSIHRIIWEIAVEGGYEGFIKASALNVIIHACLMECYWEDIKLVKNVNEVDVMNILSCYFHDPDYFVQRESVLCIYAWINAKMSFLPASCKEIMYVILSQATKSLDLELKLIALNKWLLCLKSDSYFLLTSSCDMDNYLKSLCDSGFGLSLISAVDDYDTAVKFKAATIMVELRNRVIELGYSKDFISIQENYEETSVSQKLEENLTIQPISKEDKIIALDNVMNLTTAEQISNISRPSEVLNIYECLKNDCLSGLKHESLVCSVKSFWTCLWSEKLDGILSSDSSSTSIFSEYTISLLEDIIAAEEAKVFHPEDETRDCY